MKAILLHRKQLVVNEALEVPLLQCRRKILVANDDSRKGREPRLCRENRRRGDVVMKAILLHQKNLVVDEAREAPLFQEDQRGEGLAIRRDIPC